MTDGIPPRPSWMHQRPMKIIRSRAGRIRRRSAAYRDHGLFRRRPSGGLYRLSARAAALCRFRRLRAGSARPDFAVLLFPVVTLRKPYDHHPPPGVRSWARRRAPRGRGRVVARYPCGQARAAHHHLCRRRTMRSRRPVTASCCSRNWSAAGAARAKHMVPRRAGTGWGLGKPDQVISQWPALFEQLGALAQDY